MPAVFGAPVTLRVYLALGVAVVPGIGVDDAPHRTVLGRHFGFDAAPRPETARDHDGPFHRDAYALEPLVIRGHAGVHVHERRRHVAGDRTRVVGRQLLGLLTGRRGPRDRG